MSKELIAHDVWLRKTSVLGRIRSSQLKQIDEALKAYNRSLSEADLRKVRRALAAWKAKEGGGWKTSKRNASGAVTELDKRLDAAPVDNFYTRDLQHTRLGLLYFFSNLTVDQDQFKVALEGGFDVAKTVVGSSPVKGAMSQTTGAAVNVGVSGGKVLTSKILDAVKSPPSTTPFLTKVQDALTEFAHKVLERLQSMFKSDPTKTWIDKAETWWPRVAALVKIIVSQVASSVSGVVGGAVDLATGVHDLVKACYARYQAYSLGQGVVLNSGHPAVIVEGIERAMNFAVAKGLWDTLKATGNVSGLLAGPLGAIASLVIAGCEAIIKLIHRLWEASKMQAFFADCKERYQKMRAAVQESGGAPTGEWCNGVAFGAWYRAAALALPCLPCLALTSGMAGDKMMYMKLFDDGLGASTAPEMFQRGVIYLDRLKAWSFDYLQKTGYEFSSNDALVKHIAKAATDPASRTPQVRDIPYVSGPTNAKLNGYDRSGLISLDAARAKFGGTGGPV